MLGDNWKITLWIVSVFLVGVMLGAMLSVSMRTSTPEINTAKETQVAAVAPNVGQSASNSYVQQPEERPHPSDWVKENQIRVTGDGVYIDINNTEWATFTDTNSMDPVLDMGANAIEIAPRSENDIHVGDIVSYKSHFADGIIIHRIVDTGYDSQGKYFVLKGDNNSGNDPGRIRFTDIQRVLIAIIY